MKKVPVMISTKDLSYIEDAYSWNFLVCKKAKFYSEQVMDKKIKKEMENVYSTHEDICNKLIDILD